MDFLRYGIKSIKTLFSRKHIHIFVEDIELRSSSTSVKTIALNDANYDVGGFWLLITLIEITLHRWWRKKRKRKKNMRKRRKKKSRKRKTRKTRKQRKNRATLLVARYPVLKLCFRVHR
ncbi:hypothetical protein PUN28_006241 [Cardiocondyla obscurior]|uniref:Uncharacterized protein n=1 Tax=Cardiocondyla obscurior TaxID=286306 RepID=A0AAW2G9G5_9HYME